MDFFGLGTGEILMIIIVALMLFGPGKIVEISRTLGKVVRNLRKITADITTAVTKEIDLAEKEHLSQPKTNNDQVKESTDAGTAKASSPETTVPSHLDRS